MPDPAPQLIDVPAIREGSRWVDGRPTGEEFAEWFKGNVKLHKGMEDSADKFVTGIVLISGTEKRKVTKEAANGVRTIIDETRLVHTPYAKVETRIAYFWDYVAQHDDWVGVIEPGVVGGGIQPGMPPGFFVVKLTKSNAQVVPYMCCTMRVRILKAGTVKTTTIESGSPKFGRVPMTVTEGVPIAEYPAATKMIPTIGSGGNEDPFALMKAETGAVGRALGMAGMLVIPGSGVATAEDMQEAQAHDPSLGVDAAALLAQDVSGEPEAPASTRTPASDQRAEIVAMIAKLEEENPGALEEIRNWARERRLNLNELSDTALRGVHRKLATALEG